MFLKQVIPSIVQVHELSVEEHEFDVEGRQFALVEHSSAASRLIPNTYECLAFPSCLLSVSGNSALIARDNSAEEIGVDEQ